MKSTWIMNDVRCSFACNVNVQFRSLHLIFRNVLATIQVSNSYRYRLYVRCFGFVELDSFRQKCIFFMFVGKIVKIDTSRINKEESVFHYVFIEYIDGRKINQYLYIVFSVHLLKWKHPNRLLPIHTHTHISVFDLSSGRHILIAGFSVFCSLSIWMQIFIIEIASISNAWHERAHPRNPTKLNRRDRDHIVLLLFIRFLCICNQQTPTGSIKMRNAP